MASLNLGSIAIERKDWNAALNFLNHSLAGSAPTDSITRRLFALIARGHQMLGNFDAALSACADGLRLDPDDAELLFRQAVLYRSSGHPAEAEACWRRILRIRRPDRFCSVDQGIYGHLTLRNLAVLAEERRDHAEAASLWQRVLSESLGDPEAIANLDRLRVADL
jgi:tetratricopeptide (TPR) repeat protein